MKLSDFRQYADEKDNLIRFMGKYHKLENISDLYAIDKKLIITRNPCDRLFSGFVNQFLMKLNKKNKMHEVIERYLQKPAEEISFQEFLLGYVFSCDAKDLDGHFAPQVWHLEEDVNYNLNWSIESLYCLASQEFGKEVSNSFFKHKFNDTSSLMRNDKFNCYSKASDIFIDFKETGRLPSKDSVVTCEIESMIKTFYREDFLLFNESMSLSC